MKKFAIATLLILLTAQFAMADWVWERRWTGCGYTYHKVYRAPVVVQKVVHPAPVIKREEKTTVVNNLIGIPVPVNYNQPIAEQGTTVYGYPSLSQFAQSYGQVDLALLYNQAARLTDQAQQLAGQANLDFQALVQAEGNNRAAVAKIIAQGMAAKEALRAAKGDPVQPVQRSFTFKVTQDPSGQLKVEKVQQGTQPSFNLLGGGGPQKTTVPDATSVSTLLQNKCVRCHSNSTARGGLNLLGPITDAQQKSILTRVTTSDTSKRMPQGGPPLTVQELSLLFKAMNAN